MTADLDTTTPLHQKWWAVGIPLGQKFTTSLLQHFLPALLPLAGSSGLYGLLEGRSSQDSSTPAPEGKSAASFLSLQAPLLSSA